MSRCARIKIASRAARMLAAAGFAAATATSFTSAPAPAAPLTLPDGAYKYTVIDQDIVAALQAFAGNLNLKINISPEVSGRVQGKWPEASPRKFLDWLSGQGNFEWYFDGLVLHISAAKEAQTRFFVLPPITLDQFKTALDALSVSDDRYGIQSAPGNALVKVAGPPRFVALAEQTLTGLVAEARTRPKPDRTKEQNPAKIAEERKRPGADRPKVQKPAKIAEERKRQRPDRPKVQKPARIAEEQMRPGPHGPRVRSLAKADSDSGPSCQDCHASQPFPPYPRPHVQARNGNAPRHSCQDCRAPQPLPTYPHPHVEAGNGNTAQEQGHAGRDDERQLQPPGQYWPPGATRGPGTTRRTDDGPTAHSAPCSSQRIMAEAPVIPHLPYSSQNCK